MCDLKEKIEELNQELPQLYADYKHNKRVKYLNKLICILVTLVTLGVIGGNISLLVDHHYIVFSINLLFVALILLIYNLKPKDNFISNVLYVKESDISYGLISAAKRINYINELNFLYRNGQLTEGKLSSTTIRDHIISSLDSTKLKKFKKF